jgi:hypothetical protein
MAWHQFYTLKNDVVQHIAVTDFLAGQSIFAQNIL